MKELTDTERLEIAMSLLGDEELDRYADICEKREAGCPDGICEACQLVECPYTSTNPEAHGFHDTPAECEDLECKDCPLSMAERKVRECPYLDD